MAAVWRLAGRAAPGIEVRAVSLGALGLVLVVVGAVVLFASAWITGREVVDLVRRPDPRWAAGLVAAFLTWPIGMWVYAAMRSSSR